MSVGVRVRVLIGTPVPWSQFVPQHAAHQPYRVHPTQGHRPGQTRPHVEGLRTAWPAGSPLAALRTKPRGFEFRAEVDASELTDKGLPGQAWACRSVMLSKSAIAILSRRMIHVGKQVVLAIHRIDDEPVGLFGKIAECEYHADGLHVVLVELLPVTDHEMLGEWTRERARLRPR